jgi:hypothetical protein
MSLFTARGNEAKELVNKKNVDLKKVYIKLKDGQSIPVRLLGLMDYQTYKGHEAFSLGIYLQPCVLPAGKRCAYDEVLEIVRKLPEDHELKKFEKLYPKDRVLFAFADIDAGEIRFLDISTKQAKKLIADIEQYKDHIDTVAFNLTRTGEKTDTTYSLNPILTLNDHGKKAFAKFDGQKVTPEMFEEVLVPRAKTFEQQLEILKKAGFPVEQYFDVGTDDDVQSIPDEPEKEPEEVF